MTPQLYTHSTLIKLTMESPKPTDSHALAAESVSAEPGEPGAVQPGPAPDQDEQHDVHDAGWKDHTRPSIQGVSNESMSTLLRRFDNQIFHVRKIDEPPLANLDLNMADGQEFSPVKLRANLERFYTSVVVQLVALWTHIARIRSWKEYQRTSCYLAAYLVFWLLNALLPATFLFLIALILFPHTRDICFPPVPVALIASRTTPEAARNDTVTDTAEDHAGEGAEQEAHSFLNSIASVRVP